MLRATKRLIARLFCLNMKKAKNQRRLVIIVALIGVYYLGKHSSSLNIRDKESEQERYLRGPFHNGANYTGVVVEGQKQAQFKMNLEKLLSKFNDSPRVIQKGPNGPQENRKDAVKITGGSSTTAMAGEPKVTPTFPAEQINQQVKKPQINNRKVNKQYEDTSQMHNTKRVSDSQTPTQEPHQEVIASTGQPNDKSLVQVNMPKPTITTPRTPPQTAGTTKPTTPQTAPSEGSTSSKVATKTTTPKNVDATKVGRHLQDLLKDKRIFGFVNKNATYQFQHTDILETASYSQLLQYQISRTKPPSKAGSQNNNDLLYKYGYSKTTSDKLPLLRSLPDNRDSR